MRRRHGSSHRPFADGVAKADSRHKFTLKANMKSSNVDAGSRSKLAYTDL